MMQDKGKKIKWSKIRNKYKLVILNEQTYEERFSIRLSRISVLIGVVFTFIIWIAMTIVLITLTPLREYIPGYTDISFYQQIDALESRTDSLYDDFRQKSLYVHNLKMILEGKDTVEQNLDPITGKTDYENIEIIRSAEDSIMRADFEKQSMYNIFVLEDDTRMMKGTLVSSFNFFTPLNGILINPYSPVEEHFGVDIVSRKNEAVKATLDGVVIFADWTLETGYVIGIQHKYNLFSVYKHNSSLLKATGEFVRAGEPIAIVGESGELSTGTHLHFEIWYNGISMNPAELMIF